MPKLLCNVAQSCTHQSKECNSNFAVIRKFFPASICQIISSARLDITRALGRHVTYIS